MKTYWDGGSRQIKTFIEQHVGSGMCSKNPICNALQIADMQVEVSPSNSPSPVKTTPPVKATKAPLRHGRPHPFMQLHTPVNAPFTRIHSNKGKRCLDRVISVPIEIVVILLRLPNILVPDEQKTLTLQRQLDKFANLYRLLVISS
jgi:hypothetical protein